jgi:acetylornithine deacetylase
VFVNPCVQLLTRLIASRTDNPGGDEVALCKLLADELRARDADLVTTERVPRVRDGAAAVGAYTFARWGEPRTIINVHIDTVPANAGWSTDPWTAVVTDDRVIGLGAADTKGAAAAALIALESETPRDFGILFSGDEERGGTCIRAFLETDAARPVQRAIVCEPTGRVAGIRHRGMTGFRADVQGKGGHSSGADHMPKPIVTLARLAVSLDELGRTYLERGPDDMKGVCLNVAVLDGGVAFNVVPDRASLTWSLRPPPGFDVSEWAREVDARVAAAGDDIRVTTLLDHPPFTVDDPAWIQALLGDRVASLGPLQFWTEAAVLAGAGIDAVVVGPGDIGQAHAANEFVPIADLDWAVDLFAHVMRQSRAAD